MRKKKKGERCYLLFSDLGLPLRDTSNEILDTTLGRGEAVTQRTLDPLFGGSNPPAPAIKNSYVVVKKIVSEGPDENITNRRIWTYSTNQV